MPFLGTVKKDTSYGSSAKMYLVPKQGLFSYNGAGKTINVQKTFMIDKKLSPAFGSPDPTKTTLKNSPLDSPSLLFSSQRQTGEN